MGQDDERIEQAKRDAFGAKAKLAQAKVVGSGISRTKTISLNLLADLELVKTFPPPWSENRAMIIGFFESILVLSWQCPGRDRSQCCHATGDEPCFPKWQEREDIEWYAQEINVQLSLVESRCKETTATAVALAADSAFELGCLFTEALNKLRWDKPAKSGEKSAKGAKEGGEGRRYANPKRLSVVETVAQVDALRSEGTAKMAAFSIVAERQGVETETIRKEYARSKK